MVRAGRPRSRGGIIHTVNREHGLHPAQASGKAPGSALKYHSPLEGESQKPSRMAKADAVGGRRGVPGRALGTLLNYWNNFDPPLLNGFDSMTSPTGSLQVIPVIQQRPPFIALPVLRGISGYLFFCWTV